MVAKSHDVGFAGLKWLDDREKVQLLEAMSAAKNNEFSAVWIQGEAGYGKSFY